MANIKITDLTEDEAPTIDDVIEVVDIGTNTSKKAELGNLPVSSPQAAATAAAVAFSIARGNHTGIQASTTVTGLRSSGHLFVAASTATAKEKEFADYVCDGTADQVEINAALVAVKNTGGKVLLSAGIFNCSASIVLAGETANSVGNSQILLWGAGQESTIIAMADNNAGISLIDEPKYDIGFMQINVGGSGNALDQQAGSERGNHLSHVHDINIIGNFFNHTGWGIFMESPFRMRFTNIEMNGVGNGMWLTCHTNAFNPGNLTVDRVFIDLWNDPANANAIGIKLSVENTTSTCHFNLTSWNCIHIYGGNNLTNSIGIQLVGATASFGETRQNDFNNMNLEDLKYAIDLVDASDNSFTNIYYCRILNGGTLFRVNNGSFNNTFENAYLDSNQGGTTVVVIDDAGNDANQPNSFSRLVGFSTGSATLNGNVVDSTVIENMALTEGGATISSTLNNRNNRNQSKSVVLDVIGSATAVAVGDNQYSFIVPSFLNKMKIVAAQARVFTAGVTGLTTVQVHNATLAVDVLSTRVTIDSTEISSYTAATPPVINASNNTLTTGDIVRIDVDTISTTAPLGLQVVLEFKRGA